MTDSEWRQFFAALDEAPRTPATVMVQDGREVRHVSIRELAEFRSRPRLERARNLTALLGHLLEREEQHERPSD